MKGEKNERLAGMGVRQLLHPAGSSMPKVVGGSEEATKNREKELGVKTTRYQD